MYRLDHTVFLTSEYLDNYNYIAKAVHVLIL